MERQPWLKFLERSVTKVSNLALNPGHLYTDLIDFESAMDFRL
jgi:hypothetical protein